MTAEKFSTGKAPLIDSSDKEARYWTEELLIEVIEARVLEYRNWIRIGMDRGMLVPLPQYTIGSGDGYRDGFILSAAWLLGLTAEGVAQWIKTSDQTRGIRECLSQMYCHVEVQEEMIGEDTEPVFRKVLCIVPDNPGKIVKLPGY